MSKLASAIKPSGETYAAVYSSAPFHPKFLSIEAKRRVAAFGFYVAALVLCQTYRNDGRIPREQLVGVFSCLNEQRELLVSVLTQAGLFEEVDGAIVIHDYLQWNKSKAQIEAGRAKMSEGGAKGGIKSGQTRRSAGSKGTLQALVEESSAESAVNEKSMGLGSKEAPASFGVSPCPKCGALRTKQEEQDGWCPDCKWVG